VEPVFKPPFDIIWKLAKAARKYKPDQKKEAAEDLSTACPIALPSVVSERTPREFYLIPKYHLVFDKGLQRGKKIDFTKTKFEVF